MTDEQASRWSWGATLLCCAYIAWICYVIGVRVPTLASLLAGLGGELPRVTTFVIALSKGPVYMIGAVLILGLILKEVLVKKRVVRFALTVIALILVAWFAGFVTDAMYKPMFEILEKIG